MRRPALFMRVASRQPVEDAVVAACVSQAVAWSASNERERPARTPAATEKADPLNDLFDGLSLAYFRSNLAVTGLWSEPELETEPGKIA